MCLLLEPLPGDLKSESCEKKSGCIEVYINDSTSLLIYSLSKLCKHEFMVSISSFKSSSKQLDINVCELWSI